MSAPSTLAVCCAVLRRGDLYLIVQRPPGKNEALKWEFPGGKVEAGESDAACIRREIHEELGIDLQLRGRVRTIYKESGGRTIKLMAFLACPSEGELVLHEHQDFRWVRAGELLGFDLCAGDRDIASIVAEANLENQRWWESGHQAAQE